MLASKYADPDDPKPAEEQKSPKSATRIASRDAMQLPTPLRTEIEKFDWADEPMDSPLKTTKVEVPTSTPLDKSHSRRKSTLQTPTAVQTKPGAAAAPLEKKHSSKKSIAQFTPPQLPESLQSTPQSEKKHSSKKSVVPTASLQVSGNVQTTTPSETRHLRKKTVTQVPQVIPTSASNTPPITAAKKKRSTTTSSEGPLIDLTEPTTQVASNDSPPTSKKPQGPATTAKQLTALTTKFLAATPPKPDPTSQAKPSTPDLVQRSLTLMSAGVSPAKKKMSKMGRPCVIRMPKEEEEIEHRRQPWSQEEYASRIDTFEREGLDIRGWEFPSSGGSANADYALAAQSCVVYPSPAEENQELRLATEQGHFPVVIPDKRKWDEYMQQMMEDKLKALGVKPAGEEPALPSSEDMSRQASTSFAGLANSPPPLSSSVNSQHGWQAGMPFSNQSFSPTTFTNNTSVVALGSSASTGPKPSRPGHLSRQSTFNLHFAEQGLNSSLYARRETLLTQPHIQGGPNFSPMVPGGTSTPSNFQRHSLAMQRASPDMFSAERALSQTPRVLSRQESLLGEQTSARAIRMSPQHSQQRAATVTPPLRSQSSAYGELAYPTPRGDRHNISQKLERRAEDAEYYPGEYVHGDHDASKPPIMTASETSSVTHRSQAPSQTVAKVHKSKDSASGFNVAAEEFIFEPRPSHSKIPSIGKNPFMPSSDGGRTAVSMVTAHANGETSGGGNFNATAPAFKPPGQSRFNFSSAFDFSAKKPQSILTVKEVNTDKTSNEKIFSSINVTEDIVKPARKSKAIPIVNPDALQVTARQDAETQEDEEGRIAQSKDRFKRSKPTMLDGQNEPKFDLPRLANGSGKSGIATSPPKLDSKIDAQDSDFDEGERDSWHDFSIDVPKQRLQTALPTQEQPAKGTYVPPHRRNAVQDAAEVDAVGQDQPPKEAPPTRARTASLKRQQSRSVSPRFPPGALSPTYQEIDAIMENLNGEPNFGMEEQAAAQKLPASVKFPTKKEPSHESPPQVFESKLTGFQAHGDSQSPAISTDWIREQQQAAGASASPVRKLVGTRDTHVSDWDDMLESGDESKFVPHAQFFDTRIKSLIEGVLQQHLSPLQKSLKEVDTSVRAASTTIPAHHGTGTEKTDSDADDEDNADESQPNRRTRKADRRMDQIRTIVMEAVKPLATGHTAIPDATEIRDMFVEELKVFQPRRHHEHSLDLAQIRAAVEEAMTSSKAVPSGLDLEQVRSVIVESSKALEASQRLTIDPGHLQSLVEEAVRASVPIVSTLDPEQARHLINQAVASAAPHTSPLGPQEIHSIMAEAINANLTAPNKPLDQQHLLEIVTLAVKASVPSPPEPRAEFDPEHMKLVVAETIKAFGIASSSIDPEQMQGIVTEALKSSTPVADPFDPEHMKLVVAETIKAFGGPYEPIDHGKVRDLVAETVKSHMPAPGPVFDPDEIRAIVKEVVNFSKAEDTSLEPEHIRSIIVEALTSTGISEAISSSRDASSSAEALALERLEAEVRLRHEAESRSKDLRKELEISEKEINLYKENSTHTDNHMRGLRHEKQSAHSRIEELEKAERELRTRMSGQSNQVVALESTLEEYRKNANRWREELDSARQSRESLQAAIGKLREEADKNQQQRDELTTKAESLQEKLASVARNFSIERDANVKKNDTVEALKEKLQFANNAHSSDREAFRRKDEEAAKELTVLSARLEEEMRIRQRLEANAQTMSNHERNAIKATVQLDETRQSNARLLSEIQKLREENMTAQSEIGMREKESMGAKEIARSEIQRTKSLLEADMEVAKRKFDGVRTELETRLYHVRQELESVRQDADQQRKDFSRRAEEANHARTNAIREAMENVLVARNEERTRFDRHINELSREHEMAMSRALGDHQRGEIHFNEALKVKEEKLQLLEEKCKHLEDKVVVAQSAAQAAATAAQHQQATQARTRETLRPSERVSPQALRESIVVLQEQLQQRESRIETLEAEHAELAKAKEAETKLAARETEINWLRELLGVRVDDLSELVNLLSGEDYEPIEARDTAIRIRANLQMEQQEKERLIGHSNKAAGLPTTVPYPTTGGMAQGIQEQGREMLRDVSNFATPRAAQIAAAWGNWRRGQASPSLSGIRDAVTNPNATPPRRGMRFDSIQPKARGIDPTEKVVGRSASAAQTFLNGLMTPPASNYVRRTPTPTSNMYRGKERDRQPSFSTDGRELDAQPLSLSLEEELEATQNEDVSPQLSPTRSRPSKIRTPQATAAVSENEDPLRTPIESKATSFGHGEGLDPYAAAYASRSLEDELADGMGGIGDSQEIARDSVVSPLGLSEDPAESS